MTDGFACLLPDYLRCGGVFGRRLPHGFMFSRADFGRRGGYVLYCCPALLESSLRNSQYGRAIDLLGSPGAHLPQPTNPRRTLGLDEGDDARRAICAREAARAG